MITIIGAGRFGQTVSMLLGKAEHQLVDVELDGKYSKESVEKLKKADKLVICVPSNALQECIKMLSCIIQPSAQVLSCVKGLYNGLKTPTEIIKQQLKNPVAVLMGPNLSVEIMLGRPATAAVAGEHAQEWIRIFSSPTFRPVYEKDMVGVEFGGAIKNILALGAGLIDGYYGGNACNTVGSFIAFALKEVKWLYQNKSSAQIPELSFIGDLFATCVSETSRNHQFGHRFGAALRQRSQLPKLEQTVEGYGTLQIVQKYAEEYNLPLPVISALYDVFFKKGNMEEIIAGWR